MSARNAGFALIEELQDVLVFVTRRSEEQVFLGTVCRDHWLATVRELPALVAGYEPLVTVDERYDFARGMLSRAWEGAGRFAVWNEENANAAARAINEVLEQLHKSIDTLDREAGVLASVLRADRKMLLAG
jgi:hypothetical protein